MYNVNARALVCAGLVLQGLARRVLSPGRAVVLRKARVLSGCGKRGFSSVHSGARATCQRSNHAQHRTRTALCMHSLIDSRACSYPPLHSRFRAAQMMSAALRPAALVLFACLCAAYAQQPVTLAWKYSNEWCAPCCIASTLVCSSLTCSNCSGSPRRVGRTVRCPLPARLFPSLPPSAITATSSARQPPPVSTALLYL